MESIIELMAWIGAEVIEDRFGKLAAFLYVFAIIVLGLALVFLLVAFAPRLID